MAFSNSFKTYFKWDDTTTNRNLKVYFSLLIINDIIFSLIISYYPIMFYKIIDFSVLATDVFILILHLMRLFIVVQFQIFMYNFTTKQSRPFIHKLSIGIIGYILCFPDPNLLYPIIYEKNLPISTFVITITWIFPTQLLYFPFILTRQGINFLNKLLLVIMESLQFDVSPFLVASIEDIGFSAMFFLAPIVLILILNVSLNHWFKKKNSNIFENNGLSIPNHSSSTNDIRYIDKYSEWILFVILTIVTIIFMIIKFPLGSIDSIGDAPTYLLALETKDPNLIPFEIMWWVFALLSGSVLLTDIFGANFAYFYLVNVAMILLGLQMDYILKRVLENTNKKNPLQIRILFIVWWQLSLCSTTIVGHFRVIIALIIFFGFVTIIFAIKKEGVHQRIFYLSFFFLLITCASLLLFTHRIALLIIGILLITLLLSWNESHYLPALIRFLGVCLAFLIILDVGAVFYHPFSEVKDIYIPVLWISIGSLAFYCIISLWKLYKRNLTHEIKNLIVIGMISLSVFISLSPVLVKGINSNDIFSFVNLFSGAGFKDYISIYEQIWIYHSVRPPWIRLPTTFHLLAWLGLFFRHYDQESFSLVGLFSLVAYYYSLNFVIIGFLPNRFYEFSVPGLLIFGISFVEHIDFGKKLKLIMITLLIIIFLQFFFVFYVSNNLFNFEQLKEFLKKLFNV